MKIFRLAAGLLLLLLPSLALAAKVSILESKGNVEIGANGKWAPVKSGTAIKEEDFLRIPNGASVTVQLTDGTPATFQGKAVVPGRRLVDPKTDPTALMKLYNAYQRAANTIGGEEKKGSIAGAGKACEAPKQWCGGVCQERAKCLKWDGEKSTPLRTDADWILIYITTNRVDEARAKALEVIANPKASKVDLRVAHLIVGAGAAEDANYTDALKSLDIAAGAIGNDEPEGVAEHRAVALLERGKAHMNLGANARAKKDLTEAIPGLTEKKRVAEAHFILGYIAIGEQDPKAAAAQFAKINDAEWQMAAQDAKKAAGIN